MRLEMIKFEYNDEVTIHSTNDITLDGKHGRITGIDSKFPNVDFLIISLDNKIYSKKHESFVESIIIPSSCLKH